jgi:hypothetical protein
MGKYFASLLFKIICRKNKRKHPNSIIEKMS